MILRSFGEYKHGGGGDRGRVLALWSGQAWRYQRVSGTTDILIARPVVCIVGTLQPPLNHLLGGEEDGLRPRWLPHLATLDPTAQDVGGMATRSDTWSATLTKLHGLPRRREWTLDGATTRRWYGARREWKTEAGNPDETASTSAALIKADVQCARIALILAETLEPGAGGHIPPEAMTAAIAIVDFVMDCWRAMPEDGGLRLSRRDEALDIAVIRLAGWLDEHGGSANRRALQRARVAGIRTAADLNALLARYEDTYPGGVTTVSPLGGGLPTLLVTAPIRRRRTVTERSRSAVSPVTPTGGWGAGETSPQNPRSETYQHQQLDGVTKTLSVGVTTGVTTLVTPSDSHIYTPPGDSGDTGDTVPAHSAKYTQLMRDLYDQER